MQAPWYIEEAKQKLDVAVRLASLIDISHHTLTTAIIGIMQKAKLDKDYVLADALRKALVNSAINVEQTSEGGSFRYGFDQYKAEKLFADNLEARGIGK